MNTKLNVIFLTEFCIIEIPTNPKSNVTYEIYGNSGYKLYGSLNGDLLNTCKHILSIPYNKSETLFYKIHIDDKVYTSFIDIKLQDDIENISLNIKKIETFNEKIPNQLFVKGLYDKNIQYLLSGDSTLDELLSKLSKKEEDNKEEEDEEDEEEEEDEDENDKDDSDEEIEYDDVEDNTTNESDEEFINDSGDESGQDGDEENSDEKVKVEDVDENPEITNTDIQGSNPSENKDNIKTHIGNQNKSTISNTEMTSTPRDSPNPHTDLSKGLDYKTKD